MEMRAARWLLLLVLAGCVPSLSAGISNEQRTTWGLMDVISDFAPDRGAGAKYKVGERVFFSFRLNQPGYVTLVTIDPDTTTAILEQSVELPAGKHTFPRKTDVTAQGQATYKVFPPAGVSKFRLIFTNNNPAVGKSFAGKLQADELNRQTQAFVDLAVTRDVAETTMETVE